MLPYAQMRAWLASPARAVTVPRPRDAATSGVWTLEAARQAVLRRHRRPVT